MRLCAGAGWSGGGGAASAPGSNSVRGPAKCGEVRDRRSRRTRSETRRRRREREKKKKKKPPTVCRTHHTLDIQVRHLAPANNCKSQILNYSLFTEHLILIGEPSILEAENRCLSVCHPPFLSVSIAECRPSKLTMK